MGSTVYGFVGKYVPRGLVAWMMGVRKLGDHGWLELEFGRRIGNGSDGGSGRTSAESSKSSPGVYGFGLDGSEYVPVYLGAYVPRDEGEKEHHEASNY